MDITPYKSCGPLVFGQTSKEECMQRLGKPIQTIINPFGVEEFHYRDPLIIRFDPLTQDFKECTLLPHANATVDGINVTWDKKFLSRICARDGSPMESCGFIVLLNLGICVTGIHDDDDSQLAIGAFSKGVFDDMLANSMPFDMSSL